MCLFCTSASLVLVRLPSFEWDFTLGVRVKICGSEQTIDTKQIGTGNHEGHATIMLSPEGDWVEAVRELRGMLDAGVVDVEVANS